MRNIDPKASDVSSWTLLLGLGLVVWYEVPQTELDSAWSCNLLADDVLNPNP